MNVPRDNPAPTRLLTTILGVIVVASISSVAAADSSERWLCTIENLTSPMFIDRDDWTLSFESAKFQIVEDNKGQILARSQVKIKNRGTKDQVFFIDTTTGVYRATWLDSQTLPSSVRHASGTCQLS
jgi:alkyl hydroperoxide reductase subunit AhpC